MASLASTAFGSSIFKEAIASSGALLAAASGDVEDIVDRFLNVLVMNKGRWNKSLPLRFVPAASRQRGWLSESLWKKRNPGGLPEIFGHR